MSVSCHTIPSKRTLVPGSQGPRESGSVITPISAVQVIVPTVHFETLLCGIDVGSFCSNWPLGDCFKGVFDDPDALAKSVGFERLYRGNVVAKWFDGASTRGTGVFAPEFCKLFPADVSKFFDRDSTRLLSVISP